MRLGYTMCNVTTRGIEGEGVACSIYDAAVPYEKQCFKAICQYSSSGTSA